jgi:hypothetical protein
MVFAFVFVVATFLTVAAQREAFLVPEGEDERSYNSNARGSVDMVLEVVATLRERDDLKSDNVRIVDAACGRALWVPALFKAMEPPLFLTSYFAADERAHMAQFAAENLKVVGSYARAQVADPRTYAYPACDLLLCRNLLQYMSYEDIEKIIRNIARCDFKVVLFDSYESVKTGNVDSIENQHFYINLEKGPFNMSPGISVEEPGTNPEKLVFGYTKGQITSFVRDNTFFNKRPDPHHAFQPNDGADTHTAAHTPTATDRCQ